MDADVLASEPAMALFADHQGLAIYERLADRKTGVVTTKHKYFSKLVFSRAKQLDRFLSSGSLMQLSLYVRTWLVMIRMVRIQFK